MANGEVFAASAVGNAARQTLGSRNPVLSGLVLVNNADAVTEFAISRFHAQAMLA